MCQRPLLMLSTDMQRDSVKKKNIVKIDLSIMETNHALNAVLLFDKGE